MKDNLFTIQNRREDSGKVIFDIAINPEHKVFEGHFPDMPILPGVLHLEFIRDLMCKELGKKLLFQNIKDIKYLSPINPIETPNIQIVIEHFPVDCCYSLNAIVKWDKKTFVKLKGMLKEI
ncbi:MAG: hypothetical protein ACEPOW_13610 [Bacteroidales bacterium]